MGVDLDEVRPGVDEGTYTVRRRDNLDAFSRAVASLQSGNQRSTAQVVIRGEADTAQRYGTDARGPEIFRDDLEAGRYTVELAARDRSGNLSTPLLDLRCGWRRSAR